MRPTTEQLAHLVTPNLRNKATSFLWICLVLAMLCITFHYYYHREKLHKECCRNEKIDNGGISSCGSELCVIAFIQSWCQFSSCFAFYF